MLELDRDGENIVSRSFFGPTPLRYFDRRFSDALSPLINELMGIRDPFLSGLVLIAAPRKSLSENARGKIVPNNLFFSLSISIIRYWKDGHIIKFSHK